MKGRENVLLQYLVYLLKEKNGSFLINENIQDILIL